MLSVNTFHFAMVGIGLATAAKLQALMAHSVPEAYQIQWVNVNDPQLQCIVIDQLFADARSIQNVLAQRPVPMLKVARDASRSGRLEQDTLYWPIDTAAPLVTWVAQQLLGQTPATTVVSSVQPIVTTLQTTLNTATPDLSVFDQLARPQGIIKLMDAQGEVALIDTNKQWCWPIRNKASVYLAHSAALTYTTHRDLSVQECIRPVDLKTWLWQLLWQSPHYHRVAQPHDVVRLLSWPQPPAGAERRALLRMSAFLQQQPCRLDVLAERTGEPISEVQRLVSTLLLSGLAVRVEQAELPDLSSTSVGVLGWKTLLSKLRRQFGL